MVRSRLEHASVIWNSLCLMYVESIEKIQKRFLRYLYFRDCGIYPHYSRNPVSSQELMTKYDFITLQKRRDHADCIFLFKIMNSLIDCSVILENINIRVNLKQTRHQHLFIVDNNRSPLNRTTRILNEKNCDPFRSMSNFKNEFKKLFSFLFCLIY